MATELHLKTEVTISERNDRAALSVWYDDEPQAYTVRVEPMTAEQRADYPEYAYWVKDGYEADEMYPAFEAALAYAFGIYLGTQQGYYDKARGLK